MTIVLASAARVRAHGNILGARCAYFRDALAKGAGGVVTMPDASEAAMRVVLEFL